MAHEKQHTWYKRWPWIALGIVVIGISIAALSLYNPFGDRQAALAATQTDSVVTAFIGDLSAKTTATGQVQPMREAKLSLGVAGTVERVYVEEGDQVQAGDVLVQLETGALERAVATAKQNLIIQEANLDELKNGASASDLASAQAAVDSAQANLEKVQAGADPEDIEAARANLSAAQQAYQDLLDGPDENSIAQAEANLKNAEAALKQAQANYDQVAWRSDIGRLPQSLELEQATNNYNAALASYNAVVEGPSDDQIEQAKANVAQAEANLQDLLDRPTPAELASAQAQLASAQAQLTSLTDGASAEQIAIAQAQVEQARINLEDAQDNYAKATLTAPFDGVVTGVYVAEGEMASGRAVDLVDINSLEVVLDVDEVDMSDLAVGQPVIITLETWPDVEIPGEIVSIAPKSSAAASAIVSYQVHVSLGETDLPVRVGMTANAEIITAAKENVLLVPNQAITPDREAGKYYVTLVQPGPDGSMSTRRVEVTTGLKDADYTEITSGLEAGDRVLVKSIVSATDTGTQTIPRPAGGGIFGGGGK